MTATITVTTEESANTIAHDGSPSKTLAAASAEKTPAQISSNRRDIRRMLQNTKKCNLDFCTF